MKRAGLALLILAALALTALWPGDATWQSDEPRLIAEAWHANHAGEFARGGLWGNFGIRYGPLPTWIYQALLHVTHEPETLLLLRALLCAGATAAGLLWLARELRLPAWFAAALLAAPYVAQYHRLMWDASFALPLGTLTLAAFASFLRTSSGRALVYTVAGAGLLPTIHPQALPLSLPLLGWLVWRRRDALRTHWKPLVAVIAVLLLTHAAWLGEAVYGFVHNLSGSVRHGYPRGESRLMCAFAPLLGGNLLGGPGIVAQVDAPSGILKAALLGLWLVYPLAWIGIAIAIRRRSGTGPREIIGALAVAGLAAQAVLFGLLRIPAGPQYFFGTFAMHALLAWLAVAEWRLGVWLGAIFGVCAAAATLGLAWHVHVHDYATALGWPRLRSQVALAQKLNAFSDARAVTDVRLYCEAPQALRTLRLLLPPTEPQRESGRLFITTENGKVVVHETATESVSLDLTPLPRGWQPESW